ILGWPVSRPPAPPRPCARRNSSLRTHASKDSRSRQRVTTRTSSSASDFRTSMETNPGKPCTFPRLSAKRSTISSAAPSFTGRLLKIAITFPSELLVGDDDAAATDAFGHFERLEGLPHQLPRHLPVGGILSDSDVDLEVRPFLRQPPEHTLRQAEAALSGLAGHNDADLVVAEAGEGGVFWRRFLHGFCERAQYLSGAFDLPRREGLGKVGDVEDRHGEPLMRVDGPWQEQPVELVPVGKPGHEVRGGGPAEGLLHLAPYDGVEGLETRLRQPVRGLHQLGKEPRDLFTVQFGEVNARLDRAPDAPPEHHEILDDTHRVPSQLVLATGDLLD